MLEITINNKVDLLIQNNEKIKEVKGSWQMGMMQQSCILSSTIKNEYIVPSKVEESIEVIKNNTGIFSNFRGHSLFYLSNLLSNKENKEEAFNSILNTYNKLKENKFFNDTYLPFTAIIIDQNKNKVDIDTAIYRTKYVYDFMKNNHPFLTSSDDYCRAALIAINSKNLDSDLEYMENCYKVLNSKGFYKSNNLQSLSHVMVFDKNKNEESLNKVLRIKKLLETNNCKIDGYGYPLIGAISLLECDEEVLAKQIKEVSDKLKDVKGFGNWSLGKNNRNIISAAIVASAYADCFKEEGNLDTITNNIFLEIIIAIEIAIMVAMIAAVSAASSAN